MVSADLKEEGIKESISCRGHVRQRLRCSSHVQTLCDATDDDGHEPALLQGLDRRLHQFWPPTARKLEKAATQLLEDRAARTPRDSRRGFSAWRLAKGF